MPDRICSIALLSLVLIACRPAPPSEPSAARYLVTESPIDVGGGIRLCVAVDPVDERGVWWWGPGRTGCASRSTGPRPFHPEDGRVSRATTGGAATCEFRLGTHSRKRPFIDVRLVLENGTLRGVESGEQVAVQQWKSLDVPELPPFGRPPG